MTSFDQINKVLDAISKADNVEILLAAECSSRSWGYASKTSDHDIMFIYKPSLESYLNIFEDDETIHEQFQLEDGTEVTMTGWSLHKALKLASKSNPQLMELVAVANTQTKHTYANDKVLAAFLENYIEQYYSPYTLVKSYLATSKHHLYHDYSRFPDNLRKRAKHAIAGFRSLLLAEHFISPHNPLTGVNNVVASQGYLMSCYAMRSGQWFTSSSVLYSLVAGEDVNTDDLNEFYTYLCDREAFLWNQSMTMQSSKASHDMYKVLNDFFVENIMK